MAAAEPNDDKFAHVPPEYYVIARAGSESDVASGARSTERAQFSFCRKRLASSSTRQTATNMHMRLWNVGRFDDAVATDHTQFRNEERTPLSTGSQ
jgi:hypothetical protein